MNLSPKESIAIGRLRTRTTQCFTLLIWLRKVRPLIRPSNEDGGEIITMMQNAMIETSLISFRCLNEFLRPRDAKHRKDDVIAEDYFNYRSSGPFLSDTESATLNKRLLHLTYQDETLDGFSWKVADWTERGIPRITAFFRFVMEQLPDGDPLRSKLESEVSHWLDLLDDTAQLSKSERQKASEPESA
jgi:hypothetical protein